MDRILIVNVNWVGDVVFSTPLIKAMRKKFPQAYITYKQDCKLAWELKDYG